MPRHDKANPDAAVIHRIFKPKNDALMFFDWKSMEAVVLAFYLAKTKLDPTMAEKIMSGVDLHEEAGRSAVGDVEYYHGVKRRDVGKRITYSLIYGGGAPTIAAQLGIPEAAARRAVEAYHKNQPGIRMLADALEKSYKRKGHIRTLYGRELRVSKVYTLTNYLIQGSCSEIMKRSLVKVHRKVGHDPRRAHLVAVIHDELILDVPESQVDDMAVLIPELMRDQKIERYLPLETDVEITYSTWAEKEAYVAAA